MIHQRIFHVGLVVLLLLGLGWSQALAQRQVIQLCGVTQFADALELQAVFEDGTISIFDSDWKQVIPNLYTLIGPGTITLDPNDFTQFKGTFFVGNDSDQFLQNPNCIVHVTITPQATRPPSFTGRAIETCLNGPSDPFRVTLQLRMILCKPPAFPIESQIESQMDDTRIPAGSAPNEYRGP